MRKGLCVLIVGLVISAAAAAGSAQGTGGQKPATIVVIGCLERRALGVYTLKDYRSNVTYRIAASDDAIGWHVGHELEVHGGLQVTSDARTVKAEQIVYVSNRCQP